MRSTIKHPGFRRKDFKLRGIEPKLDTRQSLVVALTLVLVMSLAACAGVGATASNATSQPSPTPSATASPTPSASPTPTATPTPSATPTPTPSATPTPTPVPSATPTPTPTPTPVPPLAVSPASANVTLSTTQAFSATGSATPVSWSVNGIPSGNATVGTIDANGLYTAPTIFPATNNFSVTATSEANPSVSASASVLVVYPNHNADAQTLPIKLGTSGGNAQDVTGNSCCSGTLGALVSRGGNLYVLSTNSVLARSSFGVAGEPITQPACSTTASTVANLQFQSTIIPTQTSNGIAPSNVDAALAQIVPGAVDTAGTILELGAAQPTSLADAAPSATLATPQVNMNVAKSGRTTGLTCSNITVVSASVSIDYNSFCGGPVAFTALYVGQLAVSGASFSAPGDAGSLLVTTDNARPVGMLFAGNGTLTLANPIQSVLSEFDVPTRPPIGAAIVGGPDHLVSCQPTATNSTAAPLLLSAASAPVMSAAERARAESVRLTSGVSLLANPAVNSIAVSTSEDAPGEAALVVHVSDPDQRQAVPAVLDGLRTKVVVDDASTTGSLLSSRELNRAAAAKEAHVAAYISQPGIQGMGVGVSKDNPAEAAVVVFVVRGAAHAQIPALLDGVRTQVLEGPRFRAY